MPRYKSRGVHAMLSLADLQSSLSMDIPSRIGDPRRPAGSNRIETVLTEGVLLTECPIGADGSERNILQLIGPKEEYLPHFAVETRQPQQDSQLPPMAQRQSGRKIHSSKSPHITRSHDGGDLLKENPHSLPSSPLSQLDSALSSVGVTLSSDGLEDAVFTRMQTRQSSSAQVMSSPKMVPPTTGVQPQLQNLKAGSKALILKIEIDMGEYQNTPDPKAATDVKIEVWLNGCLIHASFIARIRSGPTCILHLAGTRAFQQAEIPWVYRAVDEAGSSPFTAQQRWEAVNKELSEQITARGVDKRGAPPPSAVYLRALSNSAFPVRLKDQANLGILDVVITTGLGHKLTGPWATRVNPMASNLFKVRVETYDDNTTDRADEHAPLHDTDSGVDLAPTSSLNVSTPKRRKLEATPAKADLQKSAKRRTSRRGAGEKLVLLPDHFLKMPGQDETREQAKSPRKASQGARHSESTVADVLGKGISESGSPSKPSQNGRRLDSTGADMPELSKLPGLGQGSVVTFAAPGTQRLIPQSRPARFDENEFIAGFRFVVV